jgi:hypothetical protein
MKLLEKYLELHKEYVEICLKHKAINAEYEAAAKDYDETSKHSTVTYARVILLKKMADEYHSMTIEKHEQLMKIREEYNALPTKIHYECVDCGSRYWKYNHAVECHNKSTKIYRCNICSNEHYTEGQANDCCMKRKIKVHTGKELDDEDIK